MSFTVQTGVLTTVAEGFSDVTDAMNRAALAAKESSDVVAVVLDSEENGAVIVIHDGFAYLADAAPALEE